MLAWSGILAVSGLLACGERRPSTLPEPTYRQAPLPAWSPEAAPAQAGGAGGANGQKLPADDAVVGGDIWEVEGQWVTDEPSDGGDTSEKSSTGSNESDTVADPKRD